MLAMITTRVLASTPTTVLLLGFVRTRVLMSRSRLNNRATMEADILTFTGILTPEAASVASCFPFDITISLSWFPLLCLHYIPLYHRGRETSSWFLAVTSVTLKIQMHPDGYRICNLRVTIGGLPDQGPVDWPHGLTSLDRPHGLAGVHRSGHELFPRINKKRLNMRRFF